jgi:hypothetical protein
MTSHPLWTTVTLPLRVQPCGILCRLVGVRSGMALWPTPHSEFLFHPQGRSCQLPVAQRRQNGFLFHDTQLGQGRCWCWTEGGGQTCTSAESPLLPPLVALSISKCGSVIAYVSGAWQDKSTWRWQTPSSLPSTWQLYMASHPLGESCPGISQP